MCMRICAFGKPISIFLGSKIFIFYLFGFVIKNSTPFERFHSNLFYVVRRIKLYERKIEHHNGLSYIFVWVSNCHPDYSQLVVSFERTCVFIYMFVSYTECVYSVQCAHTSFYNSQWSIFPIYMKIKQKFRTVCVLFLSPAICQGCSFICIGHSRKKAATTTGEWDSTR